jgi:hypothetical protein
VKSRRKTLRHLRKKYIGKKYIDNVEGVMYEAGGF